jgi:hypothetical protein
MINEGILRKAESTHGKEPWTMTTVHTNGTIRIQRGTKTERLSIRRVELFTDTSQNRKRLVLNYLSKQAERGFAAGAVLFDLGGNGAFWKKRV